MGELTDLLFTVLGKLGRWFNIKGKRVCFLIWAVCLLYWMGRNASMGLCVQALGCLFSLGMHVYGWWNWRDKGIGEA